MNMRVLLLLILFFAGVSSVWDVGGGVFFPQNRLTTGNRGKFSASISVFILLAYTNGPIMQGSVPCRVHIDV